jgi:hypothetical protein
MGYKLLQSVSFFLSPSHVNTIVGAVGGEAASRYVSVSGQMFRLLAATAPQHLMYTYIEWV